MAIFGRENLFLERRGSTELDGSTILDLHLDRIFALGSGGRDLVLGFDVFNGAFGYTPSPAFQAYAAPALGMKKADALCNQIMELDHIDNINQLLKPLEFAQ